MAITYRKSRKRRKAKHGFLVRMQTPGGRRTVARRRRKGRWAVSL